MAWTGGLHCGFRGTNFVPQSGIERKEGTFMKRFSKLFALTVILGLLSIPIGAVATHTEDEDQPHMQAALEALQQAKHHLEEAKHDKGGHRVAAIKAVDAAIKHVKEGMASGERHEGKKKFSGPEVR